MRLTTPNVETVLDGYRLGSDQGYIAFCSVTLVEGVDEQGTLRRILVDTGHTGRRQVLDAGLRERGLTRDGIDFAQAEVVLHPDERRYVRRPPRNDFACPEWIDTVLTRYGDRIRLVEEGTRLLPGVEIVAAPGHSAGTIAVAVATGDGIAVIAGDSIQNAMVARERRNALVFWNNEMASRTIDKLLAIGDVIYPGHDLPFRVHPGGRTEYLHEFELTLTGVTAGQPGLELTDPGFQPTVMPGIETQRLPG